MVYTGISKGNERATYRCSYTELDTPHTKESAVRSFETNL
jgi:hypothetical protein